MIDPFVTLGVPPDADEATIRRCYLRLVKEHSPEKSPQKFAEIRAAYDELRDPIHRIERQVFAIRSRESIEDIMADVQARVRTARIPTGTLLSLAEG